MNKCLSLFVYVIFFQIGFSQVIFDQGAISNSLAGANITLSDVWSVNNNIGNLSQLQNSQIGISLNNRFLIPDFTTSTIVFALPFDDKALGINYSNFGNVNYQIHKAGIGYAMKLGKNISGGIKMNYLSINLGDFYGSKSIISGDIGISAQLNTALKMGVLIQNPTLSKLVNFEDERIPSLIHLGFNYEVSEQLNTIVTIEKDIIYPVSLRAAIVYRPAEKLTINAGVGTQPTTFGFGLGTQFNRVSLNIGSQYHQILGFSPELSLTTALHK